MGASIPVPQEDFFARARERAGRAAALTAVTGGLVGALEAFAAAEAERARLDFERRSLETEAALLDRSARDRIRQGQLEAAREIRKTRIVIGAQRAAFAGQGVDVGTGSPLDVQRETEEIGRENADRIALDAFRDGLGLGIQAEQERLGARLRRDRARFIRRSSLVTGGLRFARGIRQAQELQEL